MAAPLVRCSMSLTCRAKSRPDMGVLESAIEPSTDMCDIVQDFLGGVEAIIALEHDGGRRLPRERVIEEIERCLRHRMGMGISRERPRQEILAHGGAARHMHPLHRTPGHC